MSPYIIAVLSVPLFCLCAQQWMKVLLSPIPVYNNTSYSKGALRVAKGYKVIAWGIMTTSFMLALVISFYQVFIVL